MATIFRRGRFEDAELLAWVMLAASRAHSGRGVWDLMIGASEAGCLEYLRRLAVTEPRSLCHYESFLVAEVDGHPGAALCGFELGVGGWAAVAEATAKVQGDLGWTDADLAASQKRAAPVWGCFLPDVGADWGIENVATLPEFRRRGLAGALLNEALREGRERRCRLAQIATFIGNEAAQSVYRRSGFRFSDEKRCGDVTAVLGVPGFVRLIREI
jgi:ribosomal protein S18 acetylase RimI-like enzyme